MAEPVIEAFEEMDIEDVIEYLTEGLKEIERGIQIMASIKPYFLKGANQQQLTSMVLIEARIVGRMQEFQTFRESLLQLRNF